MDALRKLGRKTINVTDISSQYWCEKQMELKYLYGKETTKEEKVGKAIHANLENETNIKINLIPAGWTDFVYKTIYTNYVGIERLVKTGMRTREITVFGRFGAFSMRGKIDQLHMKDGKIIIFDDKTRRSENIPSKEQILGHRMQLILYNKLLNDLRNGAYTFDMFKNDYWIKSNSQLSNGFLEQIKELDTGHNYNSVLKLCEEFFEFVKGIPLISDLMYIKYTSQLTNKLIKMYKLNYTQDAFESLAQYSLEYWAGKRDAMPVPQTESWKCNMCNFFGNKCTTWYEQKNLVV